MRGSPSWWWLRSASSNNSNNAYNVNSDGNVNSNNNVSNSNAVAPGFTAEGEKKESPLTPALCDNPISTEKHWEQRMHAERKNKAAKEDTEAIARGKDTMTFLRKYLIRDGLLKINSR